MCIKTGTPSLDWINKIISIGIDTIYVENVSYPVQHWTIQLVLAYFKQVWLFTYTLVVQYKAE